MKTRCCHSKLYRIGIENLPLTREISTQVICVNPECKNYLASTSLFSQRLVNRFSTVLVLSFILFFCESDYSSVSTDYSISPIHSGRQMIQCTDESLKAEISALKLICPDEVFAQIVIESNHMTSGLFRKANNMLGMRYPFRRSTTASGIYLPEEDRVVKGTQKDLLKYSKQNHFAVYDSWQSCVADYKLWQDFNFKLSDRYLTFLSTYYAEDTLYIDKIKRITR